MYFEGREIKVYAEPVPASDLKVGEVYFSVNFVDDAQLLPEMKPLVFIGRNLEPGDVDMVYFQDIDSYRQGIRHGAIKGEDAVDIWRGSEKETKHIFEFEHGLDVLLGCSLRRKKVSGAR
jgi:hypothetical protein